MNRRGFVKRSMLGMIPLLFPVKVFSLFAQNNNAYFMHGVASGDPTNDAVILWTRITTEFSGFAMSNGRLQMMRLLKM
ncbi:PhoD-like phosphatase N-terminal domain-containing protein [Flavobacterium sp. N2469]|uniref:PhoD-like phosphatase N-terminal domain-containing protein n=1 Tax=Flavobacterium sp. N2469 TaxID=2986832 RepID=UPI0022234FE2|nr:PhoD-like phosphatase N-terminal domain-containing protein [Flavobacterium sp. N2469]